MNGSRFALTLYPDSLYYFPINEIGGLGRRPNGKWAITTEGTIKFYPKQSQPPKGVVIMLVVQHHKKGRMFFDNKSVTGFSMDGAIGRVIRTRKYEAIEIDGYRFLLPRQGYSFWPGKKRWKIAKTARLERRFL
jgi:hypothetical protein